MKTSDSVTIAQLCTTVVLVATMTVVAVTVTIATLVKPVRRTNNV